MEGDRVILSEAKDLQVNGRFLTSFGMTWPEMK